jgi:L-ribulokinase
MKSVKDLVIGVDFGTDSVRTILVTTEGKIKASAYSDYPRWKKGRYCDTSVNQFRQHPLDYLEAIEEVLKSLVANLDAGERNNIKGISVDTTGSTPVAVTKEGIPLALTEGFKENPNAMFVLWKDHTAIREADEINKLAQSWNGPDFTKYVGGIYSSEWFWAKILHISRKDEQVREAAYSWAEHCD